MIETKEKIIEDTGDTRLVYRYPIYTEYLSDYEKLNMQHDPENEEIIAYLAVSSFYKYLLSNLILTQKDIIISFVAKDVSQYQEKTTLYIRTLFQLEMFLKRLPHRYKEYRPINITQNGLEFPPALQQQIGGPITNEERKDIAKFLFDPCLREQGVDALCIHHLEYDNYKAEFEENHYYLPFIQMLKVMDLKLDIIQFCTPYFEDMFANETKFSMDILKEKLESNERLKTLVVEKISSEMCEYWSLLALCALGAPMDFFSRIENGIYSADDFYNFR